jgi:hypothetical protein
MIPTDDQDGEDEDRSSAERSVVNETDESNQVASSSASSGYGNINDGNEDKGQTMPSPENDVLNHDLSRESCSFDSMYASISILSDEIL